LSCNTHTLPIGTGQIRRRYHGVLTVILPKSEKAQSQVKRVTKS